MPICKHELCTGCSACVQTCPVNCIQMVEDQNGFKYPEIDESKCIHCKKCVRLCPAEKEMKSHTPVFYMAWAKEKSILKNSSSGGAFTILADIILEQGGVVFGTSFDEKSFDLTIIDIENSADLDKLRLSKYYQSTVGESYAKAKEYLKTRKVMFCGTPCQIAGLYQFLREDNHNLLTVDLACHGVPSKKVIDSYIKSKEKEYRKRVKTFKFRLKPEDHDWMQGGVPQ